MNEADDLEITPGLATDAQHRGLSDALRLAIGGGGLLLLALGFLWLDLRIAPAYLVAVAAALGTLATAVPRPRLVAQLGLFTLLLCGVGGGAWYALVRDPALMPGLALALLGGLANGALAYPRAQAQGDARRAAQIVWMLCPTVLCGSWALYFQLLTLGTDSAARRLVLTLAWLVLGVGLLARGSRRREAALRMGGYFFTLVALTKAVLYDTTHLSGALRVLCLAGAGAVLLCGAALSQPRGRQ